jgi:hypothetical protein
MVRRRGQNAPGAADAAVRLLDYLPFAAPAAGDGASLQEAADDLVVRVLMLAAALCQAASAQAPANGFKPDLATLESLYELGEITADGGESANCC